MHVTVPIDYDMTIHNLCMQEMILKKHLEIMHA